MERPEKIIRMYAKSDVTLLEQAQTMLDNFNEDLAEFTSKYPDMDATYASDWQDAIDAADNAPDDEAVLGDQKQKTLTLYETMRQADNKYGSLVTYLKLIHKDQAQSVLDHFGYKRLRRSRNKQNRLKELMDLAYLRANSADYKAALIAKGFLQADIDELNTLAQQLETDNQEQEKLKTDRPEAAQDRINLHNKVWDFMSEVNIASTFVFADDYAHLQHYLLYPEKNNNQVPLQVIEGAVAMGSVKTEGQLPVGAQSAMVIVQDGGPLEFGLSSDGIMFNGNTATLSAPNSATYNITYFASAGNTIMIRNQNMMDEGSYRIEIYG